MKDIKLNWVKVGERQPDNSGHAFLGSPCTPFVPCLVWACYPGKIHGGMFHVLRWDTRKKEWCKDEILMNEFLQPPYEITHFCDDKICYPGDPDCEGDYERGVDDANDAFAQWNDPNY